MRRSTKGKLDEALVEQFCKRVRRRRKKSNEEALWLRQERLKTELTE